MTTRFASRLRPWLRPMVARSPTEEHRVSTPLELLLDLCFVVSVSQAAHMLRQDLAAGRVEHGLISYVAVFFAIWWAWMHFTWFASVYDTDDLLYRITTLIQITGSLILAAGVPRAFDDGDYGILVAGYGVMRVGLASQWLRAARCNPAGRRTARRYATGLCACWAGWVLLLLAPAGAWPVLAPAMVVAELTVPLWARRAGRNHWHPHHIAERFGLFTLIVLGESVLASSTAVQAALDSSGSSATLYGIAIGGLLTLFSMWWLYFARPAHRFLVSSRIGFSWGYGHLPVFVAAAAVGAGLGVNVDRAAGHSSLDAGAAGAAFTVPVAVYVLTVWLLQLRPHHALPADRTLFGLAAVLIAALAPTGAPVLGTGLAMVALVGVVVLGSPPHPAEAD